MSPEQAIREALERLRDEHGIVVTRIDARWVDASTIASRDRRIGLITIEADLIAPTGPGAQR